MSGRNANGAWKFCAQDREILLSAFSRNAYVTRDQRAMLSQQLGAPETSILNWFHNQRNRIRRAERARAHAGDDSLSSSSSSSSSWSRSSRASSARSTSSKSSRASTSRSSAASTYSSYSTCPSSSSWIQPRSASSSASNAPASISIFSMDFGDSSFASLPSSIDIGDSFLGVTRNSSTDESLVRRENLVSGVMPQEVAVRLDGACQLFGQPDSVFLQLLSDESHVPVHVMLAWLKERTDRGTAPDSTFEMARRFVDTIDEDSVLAEARGFVESTLPAPVSPVSSDSGVSSDSACCSSENSSPSILPLDVPSLRADASMLKHLDITMNSSVMFRPWEL